MTAKQRSKPASKRAPAPKTPPRFLPRARWARGLVYLAIALGYMAIMWFYVFPWVDRTFVNRPAL